MFKAAIAGGLALALVSGTLASAQSNAEREPLNRADLQCMAITAAGAGMTEEGSPEQLGLAAGMAYYLGRLEARAPAVNWLDAFGAYLLSDFEKEAKSQSDRCGAELASFGARMVAWSEKMDARSSKQAAKPSVQRP